MSLYLVLHHCKDSHQPWVNSWLDDQRIDTIQTTIAIGQKCGELIGTKGRVFVHRCAWGENVPTVCCSATIAQATQFDPRTYLINFADQISLSLTPPRTPAPGQNSYEV
jgi:hypothetical protein